MPNISDIIIQLQSSQNLSVTEEDEDVNACLRLRRLMHVCDALLNKENGEPAVVEKRPPWGLIIGFPVATLLLLMIILVWYCRRIKHLQLRNEYLSKMHKQEYEEQLAQKSATRSEQPPKSDVPDGATYILKTKVPGKGPLRTIFVNEEKEGVPYGLHRENSASSLVSSSPSNMSQMSRPKKPTFSPGSSTQQLSDQQRSTPESPVPTINLLDCNEDGCKFIKSITPE